MIFERFEFQGKVAALGYRHFGKNVMAKLRPILFSLFCVTVLTGAAVFRFWTPVSSWCSSSLNHLLFAPTESPSLLSRLPPGVSESEVPSLRHESGASIYCSDEWCEAQVTPEVAEKWMEYLHNEAERSASGRLGRRSSEDFIEGVHRTRLPSFRTEFRTPPGWWSPPSTEFRATEMMKWHSSHDSATAIATYSTYDAKTGTLWMLSYADQNEQLWKGGNVPNGKVFVVKNEPIGEQSP